MSYFQDRSAWLNRERTWTYSFEYKRVFDIVLCLLGAPFVLPVVGLIALLVKLDGGSAFYGQDRLGQGGRSFKCWKIRTMVQDADAKLEAYLEANPEAAAEWDERQKLSSDPRITRLGRLLRKTSLDELPQLFNVLKGDMSLVGPRPMMPCQRSLYAGSAYFRMRPGVTGYWQISDRSVSAFSSRVMHDERYYRDMSLKTDIKILFGTMNVILKGTGV